ncbi:cyclic nucleotide-gated ion channel [Pseudochelatococcus contaminans]|uniref:Voltage-gated potassium channel n=1 Tax=Pseudochelatococcus contaminans TaxID=1538103 RepID=A0A7W6EF67_9HYPH|nr:cyclic nucleotide-gated ion channel [Pseudochelatococcus contaminans]MBB3808581.1 voltage-gated potassium channel [Pseudochelatococcus contaminans]
MTYLKLRRWMFDILERDTTGDRLADAVYYFLVSVIIVSVLVAVLATMPSLQLHDSVWVNTLERFALIVFVVEYIARLWVAPENPLHSQLPAWKSRLLYMITFAGIIDLIAILPFVLGYFFDISLQTLLVVRLLRFFKLARYSSGFSALYLAIRHERYALMACLLILCASVLLTATAAYLAERSLQPEKFGSIPLAMWWSITTLTTVGYGDVVPQTDIGRMVGALTMVTGVIMLALPIAIISSSFSTLIQRHDFVVTFPMISRLPLFNNIGSQVLIELMQVVNSRGIVRGQAIVLPGQTFHNAYIVLDGLLQAATATGPVTIGPGDIFGAVPGLEDVAPPPDFVHAITAARLLSINEDAVRILLMHHPELRKRFAEATVHAPPGRIDPQTAAASNAQ